MRIRATLVAVAALTLAVTGCSDGSTAQSGLDATTASSAVTDTVPAGPPVRRPEPMRRPRRRQRRPSRRATEPTKPTSTDPTDSDSRPRPMRRSPRTATPTTRSSSTISTRSTRSTRTPRWSSDAPSRTDRSRSCAAALQGGTRVLVVGVIHGDEDAGADIVDVLRLADVPDGVELWLVRSMNPDGQAHQVASQRRGRRPQPQLRPELGSCRRARQLAVRGARSGERTRDAGDDRARSSGASRPRALVPPGSVPDQPVDRAATARSGVATRSSPDCHSSPSPAARTRAPRRSGRARSSIPGASGSPSSSDRR